MAFEVSLEGKKAIVTGSGRGIGQAVAIGFAKAGAEVAIVSRTESELKQTAAEIEKYGKKALIVVCDLSDAAQVKELANKVKGSFGRIDVLANVAGMVATSPFEDIREEDWDRVMSVNVKAPFLLCQAVGNVMIEQKTGGSIINTTSECQDVAEVDLGAYNASKGALKMITRTIAAEWGEYGIRANNVAPSFVNTRINKPLFGGSTDGLKGFYETKLARVPLKRHAEPTDLVGAYVYLASDLSSYVTGITILIDGGYTCW